MASPQNPALEANQTLFSSLALTTGVQQSAAVKLREVSTATPTVAAPEVEITIDYTKGTETNTAFTVQVDPGDGVKYDATDHAITLAATGTERMAVRPILPFEKSLYLSAQGTGTVSGTASATAELVGPTRPIV